MSSSNGYTTLFGYAANNAGSSSGTATVILPMTSKGDLITRNSTNNTNLAVGVNNSVLTADSSTATGLNWKTSASLDDVTTTNLNSDTINCKTPASGITIGTTGNTTIDQYGNIGTVGLKADTISVDAITKRTGSVINISGPINLDGVITTSGVILSILAPDSTHTMNKVLVIDDSSNFIVYRDDMVDQNTAQTLTNKTLTDSTTYIQDNSDTSKKVQFECSGITTGNTRTLTVPDTTGTIATHQIDTGCRLLRIPNSTSNPGITFGDDSGFSGPMVIRASGTNNFINNSAAGDLILSNSIANIRMGTSTGNAQILLNSAGGDVEIGSSLVLNSPTSPTELLFYSGTNNRKAVLYDAAVPPNSHQFYGLGVNGGTLRYQVDQTSSNHVFYAGTSTTQSNELLRILGTGGVKFTGNTTSNYTPTSLNYYEETNLFTTAVNVSGTVNVVVTIKRIGTIVILHINGFSGTLSTAGAIGCAAALPARFWPFANTKFVVVVQDNGNSRLGILSVSAGGNISIFTTNTTGGQAGFTSGTCGLDTPTGVCYAVS